MVVFLDPANAFLSSRPEWTLNEVLVTAPDDRAARLTQTPFVWNEGAWTADVSIMPIEATNGAQTVVVLLRVTPDTLRRWKDVSINPFLEARAQLQDLWRSSQGRDPGTLTLL